VNVIFLSIGGLSDLGENTVYPDLLRHFRDNGHSVYVACSREKRTGLPTEMKTEHGMKVLRVRTGNITKVKLIEKGIATLLIGPQFKHAINKYFAHVKFDIVLYSTPPITIAGTIAHIKKRDKAFTYLMLKDIFPQNALDLGMLLETGWKGIMSIYFQMQERKLYLQSDYIGCMSPANVEFLKKHNTYLDEKRIEVCPNTINPSDRMKIDKNTARTKFGLPQDKVLLVYGGNFGKPQDVKYIIETLKSNEESNDRHFVMCGSGTDFYKIKDYVNNSSSNHVTVMDSFSKQEYDQLLDACDVGLLFLDQKFTIPNFPSRLLDYMNHSMPVIAATDVNTDVGRVIEAGGFGWWCESTGTNTYREIVDVICSNPNVIEEKGILSRLYLENNYDTKIAYTRILNAYENYKK